MQGSVSGSRDRDLEPKATLNQLSHAGAPNSSLKGTKSVLLYELQNVLWMREEDPK